VYHLQTIVNFAEWELVCSFVSLFVGLFVFINDAESADVGYLNHMLARIGRLHDVLFVRYIGSDNNS
jgi:hypothetical protein